MILDSMLEVFLCEYVSFRERGLTDNIGDKLILASELELSLFDRVDHVLYFAFGHAICEKDDEGRFEDEGLAVA